MEWRKGNNFIIDFVLSYFILTMWFVAILIFINPDPYVFVDNTDGVTSPILEPMGLGDDNPMQTKSKYSKVDEDITRGAFEAYRESINKRFRIAVFCLIVLVGLHSVGRGNVVKLYFMFKSMGPEDEQIEK